ncbi:glycosyltransferase family 2 protein [Rhodanobacter sp. C05]|uniref:glycosyltransferase family 2 protein n=1 Tax=Rhodanobacter sp. C05 TaxID=1945855 RepID=UPI000985086B|nr:glycosyltransferase family 2 protein [Rhodanobacter sp. C05]
MSDIAGEEALVEPPLPQESAADPATARVESGAGTRATTFAVVITSYNYRDFVLEAVESALAQSRKALQVIVVDDGSTDGSDLLLRERYGADERVTLISGINGGQLSAFQRGVNAVHADVISFLDSDDCWEPGYLARLGALYDAREDIDFVFSDLQLFDQQDRMMSFHGSEVDLGYTAISTYVLTHWYGAPTSALSMRASWARQALDLPESFQRTWRLSADNCLVFGCSVLGAHKYYLPTGCVRYRIHGKNGWWSNQSARVEYINKMTSSALIRHYAARIGMGPECIEFSKLEFMTKPRPPWSETKRYARLVMMRRVSPWRKWERALNILRRGWRLRG